MINDTRTEPNQKIRAIIDRRKDKTPFRMQKGLRNSFGMPILMDRRLGDRRSNA